MLVVEMAKYLDAAGVGKLDETGVKGDIFIGALPESPDACIALFLKGGQYSPTSDDCDSPCVQVIVRGGLDPRSSAVRAQRVYDVLHGFRGASFVEDGLHVVDCLGMQSSPALIGRDENRRYRYSLDFQLRVSNPNRRQ